MSVDVQQHGGRLLACLALVCFCLACLLLFVSSLPYQTLKTAIDTLAVDGDAGYFNVSIYERLRAKLVVAGFVLSVSAAGLFRYRRLLAALIADTLAQRQSPALRTLRATLWQFTKPECAYLLFTLMVASIVYAGFMRRGIYYDEAFSFLSYTIKPLPLGLSLYTEPNNHLLHTLLMRIAYLLAGAQEWQLRLPALIASLLSIPVLYSFTRLYASQRVASYTVALYICLAPVVEYSTLARGYSLLTLLFLSLCVTTLLHISQPRNSYLSLIFILLSGAGFATIPTFLFAWFGILLWFGIEAKRHAQLATKTLLLKLTQLTVGSLLLGLLCYLPALLVVGPQALFANDHVRSKGLAYFLELIPQSAVWTWEYWHLGLPGWSVMIFAPLAILGFARELVPKSKPSLLPFCLFFSALLLLLIQQVVPFRRVWLYLLPLYCMLLAQGMDCFFSLLSQRPKKSLHTLIAGTLLLCLALQTYVEFDADFQSDQGTLRDAPLITKWLMPLLKKGDFVSTIAPADSPMRYYFLRAGLSLKYLDSDSARPQRIFLVKNLEPNFTKGGSPRYESIEENLHSNGYSNVSALTLQGKKAFPNSIVYIYRLTKQTRLSAESAIR